jgi:hypothetical protein
MVVSQFGWPYPILKAVTTLYVHRPVLNAPEIIDWFKSQGMETMLAPEAMHVTIAYSKARVNWEALDEDEAELLAMEPTLRRSVNTLGPKKAFVLTLEPNPWLQFRWQYFISKGASWDWPGYQPHITLTYNTDSNNVFFPFPGAILLGPECFAELTDFDPVTDLVEKNRV